MTVLPTLTVRNKHQRMAFAEWAQNNEVSCSNVSYSDEAQVSFNNVSYSDEAQVSFNNVSYSDEAQVSFNNVSYSDEAQVSFNNVSYSDEAHFHLDGVANKMCDVGLQRIHVCIMHRELQCGSPSQVMGLKRQLNSDCYLSRLRNTSVPHLLATGLPLRTQW
jgi:hypothetical protein